MSKYNKRNTSADSHHARLLNYIDERLDLLGVGIIYDNIIMIQKEPESLDEVSHFRVDFLILTEEAGYYEIFVIEVKSGGEGREHAFDQLKATANFFVNGGCEHWLDEKLNNPKEKQIWLQLVLVHCSGEFPLMLEEAVSAERQRLGIYHAHALAH